MMHIVFPQLFSMNVEGNVRRSSFVKTCQFHHGKQNTTLFGLCIQYNSKHDFYILFIYFMYFYILLCFFPSIILSWFLFLPLHASRYGPCGSDQLVVTERHKLVTNSAPSSGTVRPLRTWQCLLKHHWSWGNQNLDIGAARITYCKGQQNVAWCSIKWAL